MRVKKQSERHSYDALTRLSQMLFLSNYGSSRKYVTVYALYMLWAYSSVGICMSACEEMGERADYAGVVGSGSCLAHRMHGPYCSAHIHTSEVNLGCQDVAEG